MKLAQLLTEIEAKAQQVKTLWDEADATGKDADRDTVVRLNREIEELEKRAAEAKQDDELRAKNDARLEHLTKPVTGMVHPTGNGAAGGGKGVERGEAKTLGQQFAEWPEWQAYLKQIAPTGQVSEKTSVNSPKMVLPIGLKAVITGVSSTSGGAFVVNEQSGIYEPLGRRPLTVRDLISVRTTQSDVVEFVRQVARTNAAATVAEATATGGSSGVKPEGGMTFERVTAPVRTIAEWVAATKRALADAGQIRGIIDDELRGDLDEELEDQILTGGGTGEDFEGLDAVAGTQDQAWDTDALVTTRKARTLVRTVGRDTPTGYVMHPTDWQTIDLLKDNESRYFFGGPSQLGTPRLWGLPVVESEGQPVGNAWVGNWKKIVLWDREQAMFSVSDSHSDFFIRNLVAILAELRAALGIIKPVAFVEVDLTA